MNALRRYIAFIFLLGWLMASADATHAQVNITTPDTAVCSGGPLALTATIGSSAGNFVVFTDDVYSQVVNIGFAFTFYGVTYTQCVLSSNGFVTFDLTKAGQPSPYNIPAGGGIPGNPNCRNAVMGPYHDILPPAGGSIEYSTQGVAPNRRFVLTYCNVPMYQCTTLIASQQIVLYEGSNIAEVHIANKPTCTTFNGGGAIEGVQNAAGTDAVVVPGRNYPGTWTASNDGQRFTPSGGTYTVTAIPFQFSPTGLNNIKWYEGTSTTVLGTGSSIVVSPTATTFYRAVAQGCIGVSADTVNVSIALPSDTPVVTTPVLYCRNATPVQLTATGVNLRWHTTLTGGGVGNATAPTPSTATPGNTTYYVTQNTTGCPSPRVPIVVTVKPLPAPPGVTTPLAFCQGSTPPALTATGTDLLWYPTLTGGTGSTAAPVPIATTPGSTTYYVSQTVNGCEGSRASIVVNITPLPAPPAVTSPVSYCVGSMPAPLTATGSGLLWYTTPTGGTGTTTLTPSTSTAGSTTYYVSQTVNNCEGARAALVVDVYPPASAPTVTSPLTYCEASNPPPLTAVGSNLLWYTTATGGTGTTTLTPSTTTPGSATYYVSQTVNGCEGARAAIVVNITPLPAAPTASTPVVYCQGATATPLTATGTALLWYTTPTGGTGSAAPTPSTSTAGSTTYYVSQTVNSCEGPRAAIVVNITPLPAAPTVTSPVNYCVGSGATPLTATGTSLLWYTTATGGTGSAAPTPSTSTAGTTTYYVSQTVTNCEGPRAAIVVNVYPIPTAPTVSSPIYFCLGSTAAPLTATGTNLLWYTAATSGTGSATAPTPSTSAAGTTTYYATQTVNGCESPRAALVVIINDIPPPPPTVASPLTYCQGLIVGPLTATGTALLWYTTPTGGTGSPAAITPPTTTLGNTTYYVTQTVNGCESPRAAIVVNIILPPTAPVVTTPLSYCVGISADTLTATGTSLLWYTTPTGGTGSPSSPTPSTAVAGTTTYYVSQMSGGCESPRAAIVVNVLNNPIVTTNPAAVAICPNGFALISASGAGTYSWSPSATLSGASGPSVIAGPGTTTTYTVIGGLAVNANTTCYDTATVTVTVNPNPSIVATSNSPVCVGETIALTATAPAGSTYSWTGPGTFNSTVQNPTRPNAANGMQGVYTVTATLNGCDSEATVAVALLPSYFTVTPVTICYGETYTFNGVAYSTSGTYTDSFSTASGCDSVRRLVLTVRPPVPAPGVTTPVQICQGTDPVALTAAGQNLLWYTTPTGSGASAAPPAPSTASVGSTTYYVSQTINGCEGPRSAIVVQILYTPPPPTVATPAPYCQNDIATTLTATGNNVLWYIGTGGVGSATPPTPSTAVAGTINFYVTQTDGTCESPRLLIPVVVKPLPPARILVDTIPVCSGDTAFFTAFNAGQGAAYTWSFPPQALVHSGTDDGPYAVTWTGPGRFPIYLSVLQNGCVDTTTFVVPVTGPQTGDFLMDTSACVGEEVNINAGDVPGFLPGFGYKWAFDGGTITSGAQGGPYTVKWNQAGTRYVSLQLIANGCPGAVTSHAVQIGALPDVHIARPLPNEVCGGDTMTLRVESPTALNKYVWTPERFFENVGEGAAVRGRIYTSGDVVVTATSPLGCQAIDRVEVKTRPCCELMIPSAFSPNGDGRNDRFRVLSDGFHHDYEIRIVNRYGQTMFLSKNQVEGWDGTRNGVLQDAGVYFYHIRYDCVDGTIREKSGDITLVR